MNNYITHIKTHLHISHDKDLIIDPHASCIEIDGFQSLTKMVLLYHKNPTFTTADRINKLDFLEVDFNKYDKTFLSGLWYDNIHIISQPPPEQAEKFIVVVCKFAQSVSFIMPKNAQYAFPTNFKCLFSQDLPEKEDMVFQIWLKADY
jgi:hypothetical protein